MKTKFTLFLLLTFSLVNAQIPSFATKKSLGNDMVARQNAGFAARNNKLYIIGGSADCGPKDFTEYDPATGIMNKLPSLGGGCGNPIYAEVTFIVQNKLYAFINSTVTIFDFATNTWGNSMLLPVPTSFNADSGFVINNVIYVCSDTANFFCSYNTTNGQAAQRSDFPGSPNRAGAYGFAINSRGYLGGGNNSVSNFSNDFYEYNPSTDVWTTKASTPTGIKEGLGINVNGKGYAGGGLAQQGITPYKSYYWYEYDQATNTWTTKQNFMNLTQTFTQQNIGRVQASVTAIGNEIFVFGGEGQYGGQNDDLYKYNTVSNSWSVVDVELGRNRQGASGFFVNGKVYAGGGEDSEGLNDFWEYDTATNNWMQKANMPSIHLNRAVAEVGGKGYFVGGYSANIPNTTANPDGNYSEALLEYNPVTNVWTTKAPYPPGKRAGMIAMSYNGKLYAGMGRGVNGQPTNGFQEYDPITNTWTSKISVPFVGVYSSHFVIGNIGYVLKDSSPYLLAKYNFDTNSWTTETVTINYNNGNGNGGFAYNGFGYVVHDGNILSRYNPSTSTWSTVTNLPFSNNSQNLIPANNGIYFGFGNTNVNHPLGLSQVNDWRFLKFDAIVSNKFGNYKAGVSTNGLLTATPFSCGTGNLSNGMFNTIYDENGDLHAAVSTAGNLPNFCYEISATDLSIPFKNQTRNFGNNIVETGMFLNKSVFFSGPINSNSPGIFRLYYTTNELNKLVNDFNLLYGTSKTINDIKIIRHNNNFATVTADNNPLNNTTGSYSIYATQLSNYGTDKYYDLPFSNGDLYGEIYAVLLAGQNLSNDSFVKENLTFYPNPASTILNVSLTNNSEITKISITDLSGKKIVEQIGNLKTINIENLAKGMYVLEAIVGDKKMIEKFIKN